MNLDNSIFMGSIIYKEFLELTERRGLTEHFALEYPNIGYYCRDLVFK